MKAKWYEGRNCYRVGVPARLSETGKAYRRFFKTEEKAQKFITETKRNASLRKMKATDYSVLIFWSKDDDFFLAKIIELAGCVAHGRTREETLTNATLATQNWIETAEEIGRPIPNHCGVFGSDLGNFT